MQCLYPISFGAPGQPQGAGMNSSLEAGVTVFSMIEGGVGMLKLGKTAYSGYKTFQLTWGAAKSSTSMARTLGVQGERAVGTLGSKTRIPSLTGTAKYRIPDGLSRTTLTEVKNVKSLSLTRQLKDFHMYSTQKGLQFNLYTRPTTTFSTPLQNLINQGSINVYTIPGL